MYSRPDLQKSAETDQAFRVTVELRGSLANRVRAIVAREGNRAPAVVRRLVSQGLAREPIDEDDEKEWV